jgi:hypothetical protein
MGSVGQGVQQRHDHRAGMEDEAELVPGRHRRQDDPAAGGPLSVSLPAASKAHFDLISEWPLFRARVTPEGLLGLREIEKDFPALVEVLKRFLDFGNRIDRGHRNGQRAGGDEGSCLDLRGEHLGDMVVVA